MRQLHAAALVLLLLCGGSAPARMQTPAPSRAFATQIAALSEEGGYFDTDNLISNERSYLDVLPELNKRGIKGGAYIGVGPDQNFSYIAAVRPEIAFIVDIRRDNVLLHVLFKALFSLARTRVEYVALLLGRPVPATPDAWKDATIEKIVAHVDAPALDTRAVAALRARVDEEIARYGLGLSTDDRATIDRFHRRFIDAGVELRFQSTGRPLQSHYPTYAELLLGTDPLGQRSNYLASEASFQFIKELQQRDGIVPVTGDVSGQKALTAIAHLLDQQRVRVSTLYLSNVEYYLFSDGRFATFAANVGRLPRADRSVIIRSVFGRGGWPRGGSIQQVQAVGEFLDGVARGRFRYYDELIGYGR